LYGRDGIEPDGASLAMKAGDIRWPLKMFTSSVHTIIIITIIIIIVITVVLARLNVEESPDVV